MRTCFLNCGIGLWYSRGSDRLRDSLLQHGFPGDILIWKDWPEIKFPRSSIYNCKAAAMLQAMEAGYTTLIWGDSSIYATQPVQSFVDEINAKGYWLGQSGHNAAQTCSDACLNYFGVSRDKAEKIHDSATGLFGLNIENPTSRQFAEQFIQAARDGVFKGSRQHGGQSRDRRFLFHRNDQSAATMIAHRLGMKLDTWATRARFKWDSYPAMFHCEGM